MTKLNQIVAIEKPLKTKTEREWTDLMRSFKNLEPRTGIARTYQPKDEDGDRLPEEKKLVQVDVESAFLDFAQTDLSRLFNVVATKEHANTEASADINLTQPDGSIVTLLHDVPVTYLLFLEKQLNETLEFLKHVPTLDPAKEWERDPNTDAYRSEPVETLKTKKVPRVLTKAPATDKHPAQVEVYYEDVPVGTYTTTYFSGDMPAARLNEMRDRVSKLITAVKFAREDANSREIEDADHYGPKVMEYLFT